MGRIEAYASKEPQMAKNECDRMPVTMVTRTCKRSRSQRKVQILCCCVSVRPSLLHRMYKYTINYVLRDTFDFKGSRLQ